MERSVSSFESGLRRNGYLGSIMRTKAKRSRRGRLKRAPDDFEGERDESDEECEESEVHFSSIHSIKAFDDAFKHHYCTYHIDQ